MPRGLHRRTRALRARRGPAGSLGPDRHHADHPVGLVLREVADKGERARLVERERGRLRGEGRERDFVRTVPVNGLGAGAVTRVEGLVPDEPLVVDGIVVDERERDWHAHRDLDLRGLEARVVDAYPDVRWERRVGRRAGARRECGERQRDESAKDHAETVCDRRSKKMAPSAASAMPMSATESMLDFEGVVVAAAGASSPAATRDGLAALASTARSYVSWLAEASI